MQPFVQKLGRGPSRVSLNAARTRSSADSVSGRRYNLTPDQNAGEVAGNAWRAEAGYEGDKGAIGACTETSSAVVGSSAISRPGSAHSARAMATR